MRVFEYKKIENRREILMLRHGRINNFIQIERK